MYAMDVPAWFWQGIITGLVVDALIFAVWLAWKYRETLSNRIALATRTAWRWFAELPKLWASIPKSLPLPQYREHESIRDAIPISQGTDSAPDSQIERPDNTQTRETYKPSKSRIRDYPSAGIYESAAEHLDRVMREAKHAMTYSVHDELADLDAQKALATRSISEELADLDAEMKLAMLSPAEHLRRMEEDIRMASSPRAFDALR